MDFTKLSGVKLLELYGEVLTEMKSRGMIRSKNVVGDLGEYLVIDHYQKTKGLPKLQLHRLLPKISMLSVLTENDTPSKPQPELLRGCSMGFQRMQRTPASGHYLNML